jgi:DNA-binding MarR family transcriptional regulator
MDQLALGRALTHALRILVDDMHEQLGANGFDDLRPAFGYVLNAARTGATASDVATILGMTKQGAAKLLGEMEAAGYVARERSTYDARARPVTLTSRGEAALRAAERAQQAIERRWAKLSSRDDVEAMRRVLDAVIAERVAEGPLPLRPSW